MGTLVIPYTVETGYKNTGYKNIPVIRTSSLETFLYVSLLITFYKNIPVIRACFSLPDDVLITGFHCIHFYTA